MADHFCKNTIAGKDTLVLEDDYADEATAVLRRWHDILEVRFGIGCAVPRQSNWMLLEYLVDRKRIASHCLRCSAVVPE